MEIKEAFKELRNVKGRKFDQSVELIINLKGIDMKRDNISVVTSVPHKFKDKKVCAFLSAKSKTIPTVTLADFENYKDKKSLKNLVNQYDFFIAHAPLMPKVATTFGKVLGPTGKMPSPQLGIIAQDNDASIKATLEKISTSVKVRMKEPSFKIAVGKLSMDDEKIAENASVVYNSIVNALPKKKDNIKNVMVRLTMSKPVKVELN
jgi:large subunit ribosomal protein L1